MVEASLTAAAFGTASLEAPALTIPTATIWSEVRVPVLVDKPKQAFQSSKLLATAPKQPKALIKEAMRHTSSKGHTEWLRAINSSLEQTHQGRVNCECHLHWQRGRHHRRDDLGTSDQSLVSGPRGVLQCRVHHVARSGQGKNQKEHQLQGCLYSICADVLG